MSLLNLSALDIAKELINKESVTPNDAGCQEFIASYLKEIGFSIENIPFNDVKNLYAKVGTSGPIFCFLGHTDVVPSGPLDAWDTPPFTAVIKDDYLCGRGACDMKGSVASFMFAVKEFVLENKDKIDAGAFSIAVLLTSDEEGEAEDGIKKVIPFLQERGEHINYCLVGEPSSTKTVGDVIKNGRRGSINAKLTIKGKQGHVAYPHLADNSAHKSFAMLHELTSHTFDDGHENFPPTSLQVVHMQVDTNASNIIPGNTEIKFNVRFNPKQTPDTIKETVTRILANNDLLDSHEIDWTLSGLSFICEEQKLIDATVNAVKQVKNIKPELSTKGGTSDGRFLAPYGTHIIELGLVNETIHKVNEKVVANDIQELAVIYKQVLSNMFS